MGACLPWVRLVGRTALAAAVVLAALAPAAGSAQVAPAAVLEDRAVIESSGLAASARTPGVLWTHNDSGEPWLFATDRAGRALGRFAVAGAVNTDWEDLAPGPGPAGGAALYVGDVGDNLRARDDVAVYRVAEPAVDTANPAPPGEPVATAPAERFGFAYPDGAHDAETLLVDPRSGEVYVVTKEPRGEAGVYRFPMPLAAGRTATLEAVGTIALPGPFGLARAATGGAVAPDGGWAVVRTYLAAFEWTVGPEESLAAALREEPRRIALPAAGQGEAIAYRADPSTSSGRAERALLLTSEGSPCPLYEVDLG